MPYKGKNYKSLWTILLLFIAGGLCSSISIARNRVGPSTERINEVPLPPYTEQARNAGIEDVVRLICIVRNDGTADGCRIEKGLGFGLGESAIKTVETSWRFKAETSQGKPVYLPSPIEITFKLH